MNKYFANLQSEHEYWWIYDGLSNQYVWIKKSNFQTTYSVHRRPKKFEEEVWTKILTENLVGHRVYWHDETDIVDKLGRAASRKNKILMGRYTWTKDGNIYNQNRMIQTIFVNLVNANGVIILTKKGQVMDDPIQESDPRNKNTM